MEDKLKIINFRELSRELSGKDTLIRSNYVPDDYKDDVELLNLSINNWRKIVKVRKVKLGELKNEVEKLGYDALAHSNYQDLKKIGFGMDPISEDSESKGSFNLEGDGKFLGIYSPSEMYEKEQDEKKSTPNGVKEENIPATGIDLFSEIKNERGKSTGVFQSGLGKIRTKSKAGEWVYHESIEQAKSYIETLKQETGLRHFDEKTGK